MDGEEDGGDGWGGGWRCWMGRRMEVMDGEEDGGDGWGGGWM